MSKLVKTAALVAASTFIAGSASAATLFYDDFDRYDSSVGNGWTQLEDEFNDVAAVGSGSGYLRLRDNLPGNPDAAAASATIDATGYENIQVTFTWFGFAPNETGGLFKDYLNFAWDEDPAAPMTDEGSWNTVWTDSEDDLTYRTETVSISPGADDTMFNIMFWTSSINRANEGFGIGSVKVEGDLIPAPVPLPAAGWMLLAGLGGVAALRRRKKA